MTNKEAIKGLKALSKEFSGYKPNEEMFDMAIKALEWLPSAQPTYTEEEIQKMQTLEQAEIEKAYQLGYEEGKKDAQPERPEQPESAREYCAECDHIEMCRWYPYEGCEFRSLSSAQSEQKKGNWISKNLPICIGAKDLVEVYICSNCGHVVDGNNLSNFCSVCGFDMRGKTND